LSLPSTGDDDGTAPPREVVDDGLTDSAGRTRDQNVSTR